jgi:hypothetical protein
VLPPTAPSVPASPKRIALLAAVWLAALAAGAAAAYAMNLLRPVVSSLRVVNELTPFPVLGVVSAAFPSREEREFRGEFWRFSAATAVLIVAFAVVLALNGTGARLTQPELHEVAKS